MHFHYQKDKQQNGKGSTPSLGAEDSVAGASRLAPPTVRARPSSVLSAPSLATARNRSESLGCRTDNDALAFGSLSRVLRPHPLWIGDLGKGSGLVALTGSPSPPSPSYLRELHPLGAFKRSKYRGVSEVLFHESWCSCMRPVLL